MPNRFSFIVAGATGATGSHVVAKLVAHPFVNRVVALSRYEISYDKWPLVFPGIHMGDALRHLSVVPVQWDHLVQDAKALSNMGDNDDSAEEFARKKRSLLTSHVFYRSIFSGHHGAICALGSRNLFSSTELSTVDYEYAVAFGTLVRQYSDPAVAADLIKSDERNVDIREYLREKNLEVTEDQFEEIASAVSDTLPHTSYAGSSSSEYVFDTRQRQETAMVNTATLRQMAFLSTAGANPVSPLPYFRAHGECDRAIIEIARSSEESEANSGGIVTSRFSSKPASISIWRPSVLTRRDDTRWFERMLAGISPPLSAESLAGVIIKETMESIVAKERRGRKSAGKSPAVRIYSSADIVRLVDEMSVEEKNH